MRILYHHRTRATDAQRVHVLEMVHAFREEGHEVEIAGLVDIENSSPDPEREAGEATWQKLVRRVPGGYEAAQLGYNAAGLSLLTKKIRSFRPDFIYERYALFNFSGVAAARLFRIPLVLEVNSPLALEQSQEGSIRARKFAGWVERQIGNAATQVLVVSTPLRRILVSNGVRPAKITVMPNGVNLTHLASAPERDLREALGVAGRVVIGFVGWFRKWHGLEFLLETFRNSGLGKRGATLLLVGDGPAMPELKDYVVRNGMSGSVVFAGAIAHEQIPPYLAVMDIAVQPAANEYCCPMKVIEYMGLAKPIVAPRQENIQDLLQDEHDALLFTPGNPASFEECLTRLVESEDLRKKLGAQAFRSIHERGFLWSSNAQAVAAMIRGTSAERAAESPVSMRQA